MNEPRNFQYRFLVFICPLTFVLAAVFACQESEPSEPLEAAFNVIARDNGNAGNASDIEVGYHQFGLDHIKKYRIYIVKSESKAAHDLAFLQALGEAHFVDAGPNEVVPTRGVHMPSAMLDSDGGEITVGVAYRAAVISLPYDAGTYLPTIAYSEQDIVLSRNNLVFNLTNQLEVGAGALAINGQGEIVMAPYDVVDDFITEVEPYATLISTSSSGIVTVSDEIFPNLGGADSDQEGNFYVSNILQGEIIRYPQGGLAEVLTLHGEEVVSPGGVFIDQEGVVFVADSYDGRILRIDKDGVVSLFAEVEPGVRGLTGDEMGNLYASINSESGTIYKISPEGRAGILAQIPTYVPPDYLLEFIMWLGHIEYHEGKLYVAGTSTHRLYTVSMDGEVSVFAGSGDRQLPYGDILTADFNRPMGLAFSADGKTLYVSGCEDTYPSHTQASYPSRIYKIDLVD